MASAGTVFIIGAGSSGTACARTLAAAGWDVTIAERDRVGGACLWRGCVPKKALYTTARMAREIEEVRNRGTFDGEFDADWQGALAWKWHSQETYAGDQEGALAERGIRLLKSNDTRFVSAHEIESGGERFTPDHIVIATGSIPLVPALPGIEFADTSEEALRYHEVPRSFLVVGGGFVGTELGTIYASFGSDVTIVTHASRLLDMLDEDIAEIASRRLLRRGVTIRTGSTVLALTRSGDGISAHLRSDAAKEVLGPFERVLFAIGRVPAVDGLDLEAASIEQDERGHLVLDGYLRTTNPRVWAVGDAAGGMMQTPVANMEGHTVARSIAGGQPLGVDTSAAPMTAFTSPQLAQAGLTTEAAERLGIRVRVTIQPFEYLAAAIIDEERDGLVKLVFEEESGRLVGGAVAAPSASDLIYSIVVGMAGRVTQEQLAGTVAVHPAFSEGVAWAAG